MRQRRTIGRLAAETGVGVETIRYYERRGLIRRPRSDGGYRDYSDEVLATVRYIRIAQHLGLSLSDIEALKERLHEGPGFCAAVRATVSRRLATLEREMAELRRLEAELTGFLDRCTSRPADRPCPILQELHALDTVVAPHKQEILP